MGWKSITGTLLVIIATFFNWQWFWTVLLFLGLINSLYTKEIHFFEAISKKEQPIMYWIQIGVLVISIIFMVFDLWERY